VLCVQEAPKDFLMVKGLRETFPTRLQQYYDRWLEVHDGAEGWPDVRGLLGGTGAARSPKL
jgi:hypothetical protein